MRHRHRHLLYHYWWYQFPVAPPVPPMVIDPALIADEAQRRRVTRAQNKARTVQVARWVGWAIARRPIMFAAWMLLISAAAGLHLSWLGVIGAGLGLVWATLSWRQWEHDAEAARVRERWEDEANASCAVERIGTPPFEQWAVKRGHGLESLWGTERQAQAHADELNNARTRHA